MRVRKNVFKLAAADNTLEWYGKAVAAMWKRPATDPTSWQYQATIHGTSSAIPPSTREFWAQCQHGSSFFLPWHRMYVHQFERIVAATIVQLGGPADWALPYWNYSSDETQRTLPPAFRAAKLTSGDDNPLYVAQRNPNANAGASFLDAKDVDLLSCLGAAANTGPTGFFGGPPPAHSGGAPGGLELTPHNAVHRQVGLGGGWMTDPDFAALDPIFWLHHANIDRLWEVWRKRDSAHKNPTSAYWLTGVTFGFHDATGKVVSMRTADVLDTTSPALDYSYDDTSDPLAHPRGLVVPLGSPMPAQADSELVGATTVSVQLDANVTHVSVPTPITPAAFRQTNSPNALLPPGPPSKLVTQVTLELERVTSAATAPTYDVYLNVPGADDPTQHEDRFVSRVAMFGIAQASDPTRPHGGGGQTFAFDITDLYRRLADAGEIDFQNLRVSFVPVKPEGAPQVSVGRINLYFA